MVVPDAPVLTMMRFMLRSTPSYIRSLPAVCAALLLCLPACGVCVWFRL